MRKIPNIIQNYCFLLVRPIVRFFLISFAQIKTKFNSSSNRIFLVSNKLSVAGNRFKIFDALFDVAAALNVFRIM